MRIVKVLDSGEMKIYPEVSMSKDKFQELFIECNIKNKREKHHKQWCDEEEDFIQITSVNPDYEEYTPRLKFADKRRDEWIDDELKFPNGLGKNYGKVWKRSYEKWYNWAGAENIYAYLGRIPFSPCVMINISPNWKGSAITDNLIEGFQRVIEGYLGCCGRYSKWKYCCESGSEGNFLHAHIVAEINPELAKSVETHINNGNHAVEIRKLWKKNNWKAKKHKDALGIDGKALKFAIQRIMLRTEVMRDDKLAYLIEENKPETHRNKFNLGIIKNSGF